MVPLEEILEHACSAIFASDWCLPSTSNAVRDDGNMGDEIINHVHDRDDERDGRDVDGDDEGNGIVSYYSNDSVSSVKAYSEASDVSNEDSGGGPLVVGTGGRVGGHWWQSQPLLERLGVYGATLRGRQ